MTGHLDVWTVCRHPSDYPDKFTARRSEIRPGGPVPTSEVIVSADLRSLRQQMRDRGLVCLARDPGDDAVIVEVWL